MVKFVDKMYVCATSIDKSKKKLPNHILKILVSFELLRSDNILTILPEYKPYLKTESISTDIMFYSVYLHFLSALLMASRNMPEIPGYLVYFFH